MRRRSWLLLTTVAVALIAGCSAGANDPYEIAARGFNNGWDPVQANIGIAVESGGTSLAIDEEAIRVVIDGSGGEFLVDISIQADDLQVDPAMLGMLGIDSDSIDLEAVFDGDALYVKSPLLAAGLSQLLAGSPDLPRTGLDGWLRLATMSELETLMGGGPLVAPDEPAVAPAIDAASLRREFEASGITLSYVGSDARDVVATHHVHASVDIVRFVESPAGATMSELQRDQLRQLAGQMSLSFDFWIESTSSRLSHVDMTLVAAGESRITFSVSLGEPDPGTVIAAPSSATIIPFQELVEILVRLSGTMLQSS